MAADDIISYPVVSFYSPSGDLESQQSGHSAKRAQAISGLKFRAEYDHPSPGIGHLAHDLVQRAPPGQLIQDQQGLNGPVIPSRLHLFSAVGCLAARGYLPE